MKQENNLDCLTEKERENWKKYGEFDESLIQIEKNMKKQVEYFKKNKLLGFK